MRRYLDDEIDKGYPQQQRLTEAAEEGNADVGPADPPETDGGATVDVGTNVDVGPDAGSHGDADAAAQPDAGGVSDDATDELLAAGESPECPECSSMTLYYSEGCKTCESCGWSEC
jgi:ribonucleoside-diphosphate reductase alpha chain